MIVRCSLLALVLVSCGGGDADDFWSDSVPDEGDGTADPAAGDEAAMAGQRVDVHPGKLDDAEMATLLHVGRSESTAPRRVMLQLAPGQIPQLAKGDRLITPAEVQVTTRCDIGQVAPGCDYNPTVRAQIIITGNPADTSPSGDASRSIASDTQSCTKNEHHCMFVFGPEASIDIGNLPCAADNSCYVNLVMWAWSADARSGDQDVLLVGGNDGNYLDNGRVDGDQGRLMVVRERGITGADRAVRESSGGGNLGINTNANPVVIYSHRLKPAGEPVAAGEQFLVEAKVVTAVSSRARFSTEMFLTKNAAATEGNGVERISPSQINEHNGVNCTPGDPCVTHKVAVFRVDETIDDAVFVNVIAKSAVPGGAPAQVTVKRDDGWVRAVRYKARLGK